jgi:hypothetical protein
MFFIASQSGSHPAPSTSLKAGSSRNSEHAAKSGVGVGDYLTEVCTLRKANPFSFQPLLPPHGEKKPKQIKQGNASNQCPQNMHWRIENNQNE